MLLAATLAHRRTLLRQRWAYGLLGAVSMIGGLTQNVAFMFSLYLAAVIAFALWLLRRPRWR
jgi:hypothetical protein